MTLSALAGRHKRSGTPVLTVEELRSSGNTSFRAEAASLVSLAFEAERDEL